MDFVNGRVILNRYKIVQKLGQGGFGKVFLAEDLVSSNQKVAIKIIDVDNSDQSEKEQTYRQFLREASILANLSHSHLPKVTNFGDLDEYLFMVMDFISGESLYHQIIRRGALPEKEATQIIDQVLDTLIFIHGQIPPIIHRDIKPANIIIHDGEKVFLVDFGISKIGVTYSGAKGYSKYYSPPEQHGKGTDPRSDIYSLGATMYCLITGKHPTDSIERLRGVDLVPLRKYRAGISPDLERIVMRALAMKPESRYQSAHDFRSALSDSMHWLAEENADISIELKKPKEDQLDLVLGLEKNQISKESKDKSYEKTKRKSFLDIVDALLFDLSIEGSVVGGLLFGLLSFGINSLHIPRVFNIAVQPSVSVLMFTAYEFGPMTGLMAGMIGPLVESLLSGNGWKIPFPTESLTIGFLLGVSKIIIKKHDRMKAIIISEASVVIASILSLCLSSISTMRLSGIDFLSAIERGIPSMVNNVMMGIVLMPVLLIGYRFVMKSLKIK